MVRTSVRPRFRPKAGQLLPLGKDRRFPSSVIPDSAARGPRGPEGPAGTAGATGPSEGFVQDTALATIPFGAPAIVAELMLPAGAYALDFVAHTYHRGGYRWVDCQLSANGQQIVKTATFVGDTANATIEAPVAMTDAARFATTTALRALCSVRDEGSATMVDIRLRAIRLGSLTVQ